MSCITCWIGSRRLPGRAWPRRPSVSFRSCAFASTRPRPVSPPSVRCCWITTPSGRTPSRPVRISGRWPSSSWSRRRPEALVARRDGLSEEPLEETAGSVWRGEPRLGVRGAMGFEALPVVRQLSRKPDLPVKLTRARIGTLSTCRIELASLRGLDFTREGFAQVAKQIRGEGRELVAIRAAVRLRRGTPLALAQLDEKVQRRHLHRFFDALRSEEHTSELQSPCNLVC